MQLDWQTLSVQERQVVVDEMAERVKDFVFMDAKEKVREIIDEQNWVCDGEDSLVVHFEVEFVVNDLVQIIGRMRRVE